jgi:hypothetical protein
MVNKITIKIVRLSLLISSLYWSQLKAQQIDLNNIALLDVNRVNALFDTSLNTNSFTIRNSSIQFNPKLKSWKKVRGAPGQPRGGREHSAPDPARRSRAYPAMTNLGSEK